MTTIDDALDGMPTRDLERLKARIERRLQACVVCGQDGAIAVKSIAKIPTSVTFSLLICRKCIELHRQPETRAGE